MKSNVAILPVLSLQQTKQIVGGGEIIIQGSLALNGEWDIDLVLRGFHIVSSGQFDIDLEWYFKLDIPD